MNVYDQLLMEFPGIETTLTSYSSECQQRCFYHH